MVGRVNWPDPTEFVTVDMGTLLEQADIAAGNKGYFTDGPLFEATEEAEEALNKAIKDWAREWVTASYWTVFMTEEQP